MLNRLVSFKPLAPLLPSNATLEEFSDAEFQEAMDKWTKAAKSPPYVDSGAQSQSLNLLDTEKKQ